MLVFRAFTIDELKKLLYFYASTKKSPYKAFFLNFHAIISRLDRIEFHVVEHNVSLVALDSLASLVRREFTGNDMTVLHDRAQLLFKVSSKLKKIATFLNVSVSHSLTTDKIYSYINTN